MSGEMESSSDLRFKGTFSDLSLEKLRQLQNTFATERNWQQYHTPRNLTLALVGEVGELAEIFQWKGELSPGVPELSPSEKAHLGEEISDVLLYLVRLAERCEIDLSAEVLQKMRKNAQKYPIGNVPGRSDKYTQHSSIETSSQHPN